MTAESPMVRLWKEALSFLFWAILFGLAYTQAPLYYSNQNQYFVDGLAQAGRGHLQDDWLAKTAGPTPLFSSLVNVTCRVGDEGIFYLIQLLMLGVYFCSMLRIFES